MFFLMKRQPPRSPLFPNSPLFRCAPTTPIPRTPTGARLAAAVEPHHRSVGAGIALWVFVVVVAVGAPRLYAHKKGLLFFAPAARPHPPPLPHTGAPRPLRGTRAAAPPGSP